MSINQNWDRWIFASVSKHFDSKRQGIDLFVEDQDRKTRDLDQYIELRVDGPYFHELTKNQFKVHIEINVLCVCKRNDIDFHRIRKLAGIVSAAFTSQINVYKYGNDPLVLLGCLIRKDKGKEGVITSHFGQLEQDVHIQQSTVEAHYTMNLTGE